MVKRIALIALVFLALLGACDNSHPSPTLAPTVTHVSLKVETAGAVWGDKFIRGLGGRTSLDGGMLFDFNEMVRVSFQMRETLIPLSIAFIAANGVIVDIQDMEPLSEKEYIPKKPHRYALEVNQGYFAENGISVGDRVEFQPTDSPDYVTVLFLRQN